MSLAPPLVVAILHSNSDDIDYQLYGAAYGIEMQVDGDWHAEAVLLTPHDHLSAVTKNTGVTTEADSIVSAGVTDLPMSEDGVPNAAVIKHPRNNWLLVGDPRQNDTDEVIVRKLQAALDADCRTIVCLTDATQKQIENRLRVLASANCSQIVVAFLHPNATTPDVAIPAANSVRDYIESIGASGNPRFIVAGHISGKNAADILRIDGVDGVILMDDRYDDFGTILEVLEALGE